MSKVATSQDWYEKYTVLRDLHIQQTANMKRTGEEHDRLVNALKAELESSYNRIGMRERRRYTDEIREWQERCERLEAKLEGVEANREIDARERKRYIENLDKARAEAMQYAEERNAAREMSEHLRATIEDLQRQLKEQVKRRMEEEGDVPKYATIENTKEIFKDVARRVCGRYESRMKEHGPSAVERAPAYRPGVTVFCQGEEDGDI